MEDLAVRRLTKKVFPHVWLRHKLMSSIPSTGIFPFSEMTVFSQPIGNAVIVYLHMYRPTLAHYLEKHIPSMPQSKMHFWTHVAFLCLHVRLVSDNVFDYFLTVCSITAEVALHCYINGYDDVLSLASSFFCAFFENELYEGFHTTGGWVGLHRYIAHTSCPELYELINGYIKKMNSPSEHLPVLITIKCEQLAAERREKLLALRLFKIGEIERDDQAKSLVSGIFHWDFMENQRISEVRPGILKRMENVRHKNKLNITMDEERSDQSSTVDEELDADNEISNVDDFIHMLGEAQTLEPATKMFETRSNYKDGQTLKDLKGIEIRNENKNQLCTSNKTSGKSKSSSTSSLRELCDFYESLSSPSEATMDNSKCFKDSDGTRNDLKSFESKGMSNRYEKVNKFERCPKFIPYRNENGKTFRKSQSFTHKTLIKEHAETFPNSPKFTPKTVIKSTESLHVEALSELTKTFQELGFSCLSVGNSSQIAEKPISIKNYAEIMGKCRYFQSKYSSIQFAILIPNDYFTAQTSQAPETENCDEIHSETQYNGRQSSSIAKMDFENCTVSPQNLYSETEKSRFSVIKLDGNQFRLPNETGLLQNGEFQSIQKTKFVDKNVEEKDLMSRGKASEISRFSVTKVNENQMISRNEKSLSDNACVTEPITVSRLVLKFNENQSKDQIVPLDKNWTSDTTKISRFTVTKINENKSKDGISRLKKNLENETTKISRFSIAKFDENKSKDTTSIIEKNYANEETKISRFTVTKVDENITKDAKSILEKNWANEKTKISRFTVTKVDGNQAKDTNILGKNWANGTTKISRFTVTKVHENKSKDTTSILRKKWTNETIESSNFTADNQLMPKLGTSFLMKSPTNNPSTKVDGRQSWLSGRNYSISEISDDSENETIQFQDNGSVKYQKRVSFAEHPFISYYHPYSSDGSPNSSTSQESPNQNSPEDSRSLRKFEHMANHENTTRSPILCNTTMNDTQYSFSDTQSMSDNERYYNPSFGFSLLGRIFRRSNSQNSTDNESPTEEMSKQKIDELTMSLETAGVGNSAVFKV